MSSKLIGVDSLSLKEADHLINVIHSELENKEEEVRYAKGIREVKEIISVALSNLSATVDAVKIKEGGVYLISGGTGGFER